MININKRIKKKRFNQICKEYTTKKQRDANKALCKRYPFLIPRNVWSDKISWIRKPYDRTLVSEFPKGWWKAFGLLMCEELREECIKYNYLHQLRFVQIKEKFGSLQIYTGPIPKNSEIDNIIFDYSALSKNICMKCSRPDVHMLDWYGWYSPYCEDCFNKINKRNHRNASYVECICDEDEGNGKMVSERKVRGYKDGEYYERVYDLTEKADKIRARWRSKYETMPSMSGDAYGD